MDGSFEEGGWNFAHLALSLISHLSFLLPGKNEMACCSQVTILPLFLAGFGPTVGTFFRWRRDDMALILLGKVA